MSFGKQIARFELAVRIERKSIVANGAVDQTQCKSTIKKYAKNFVDDVKSG